MSTEKPNGKTLVQNPVESSVFLAGLCGIILLSINSDHSKSPSGYGICRLNLARVTPTGNNLSDNITAVFCNRLDMGEASLFETTALNPVSCGRRTANPVKQPRQEHSPINRSILAAQGNHNSANKSTISQTKTPILSGLQVRS